MYGTEILKTTYDATGRKWKKTSTVDELDEFNQPTGTTYTETRVYANGVEFSGEGTAASRIANINASADGRVTYSYDAGTGAPSGSRVEYYHKDHLGNVRLAFSDLDGNGALTVGDIYDPANEITQERHYYPFGLTHTGAWFATVAPEDQYRYNGKELDEATGLYDYGARYYDPAIARWGQVDPLAEQYASYSPYNYVLGNPIALFDPDGMKVESTHTDEDGNVIAVYDDGDLGVYRHTDATTQSEIDAKRQATGTTSGGGELMGETNYWWDFAKIDTQNDIAFEEPANGAIIHFGTSRDDYISNLRQESLDAMPSSLDPSAKARWLAGQAANNQPLDIKTILGATSGYLFQGKYVSGRALGNHLFGALLRDTKPFFVAERTWYTNTMKRVGAYNVSQNNTTFGTDGPFHGENTISGTYIARGYWGNDWVRAGNFIQRDYGY